jgi:hypothetical protein
MRKRIKEIDKDVIESGRQSWMTYRIHGRLFVAIGCVAKNGNFTLGIQNLPPDEVKLNGHRSKDWGSGAQRNKSTIITFGPTVDYKDIDNLLEYIRIAYKKASVSTDRIIDASEQIDWNLHESHLSRITNMEIKDKINYLREKIESMDSDIDKGGRGDRKGGRPGWMIYRVYGHSGRGRIFVSIGEISHKSFVVAIHPMSKARKVAGYEAKPWRRGECNPNTAVGHYRLPANISHEDLDRIIQCIRDAYMYNRSRV